MPTTEPNKQGGGTVKQQANSYSGMPPYLMPYENTTVGNGFMPNFEPSWFGIEPKPTIPLMLQGISSNGMELQKHIVSQDDTLYQIAGKYNISLQELLYQNNFTLLNASNGLITDGTREFQIQPGMQLSIPATRKSQEGNKKSDEQKAQETELNEALSAESTKTDPLKAILKALLGFPLKTLGTTKGSKQSIGFMVNIPIPGVTVVAITFGGEFEQERKGNDSNEVQHTLKPKLGVKLKASDILKGEIILFGAFSVTSATLDQAVDLIYYGLYKLGRTTGDSMNDWGSAVTTGGTSVGFSLVMFCGLNLLYGKDDSMAKEINNAAGNPELEQNFIDKIRSAQSAEANVEEMEKDLFGFDKNKTERPFDENNPNEVSYGGGVEGKLTAGTDQANTELSASLSRQSVINAGSLNDTGVYGAQDTEFTSDYKTGDLKETQLSIGVSETVNGHKFGGNISFTWGQYRRPVLDAISERANKDPEIVWGFKKFDYELFAEIANMDKMMSHTAFAFFEELIEKGVTLYEMNKDRAKDEDPSARMQQMDAQELANSAVTQLGLGVVKDLHDISFADASSIELSNKVKVIFKASISKDPNATGKLSPGVQLIIGTVKGTKIDLKVVEFESSNFTPLLNIELNNKK